MANKTAKKEKAEAIEDLELDYQLAELPSSQHRSGLAGLVLMVRWLERLPTNGGICQLTRVDRHGATLRIDKLGLEALFNEVYAASREEREYPRPFTKKNSDEIKPPIRTIEKEVTKKGKTETKTFYIYPGFSPKGALLVDSDPSAKGLHGIWVKLWREMIFSIFRGRDKQRIPFKTRAEKQESKDVDETWDALCQPFEYSVKMPSTFFVGAQETNADDVPFKDRAKYLFLLHFWTYVAQIYVPRFVNNKWEIRSKGYALAIPDIANLEWFCEELPKVLRYDRSDQVSGFVPRDSVIDLAVEGALDILSRLRERVAMREGDKKTSDLVLGIDVVHVEKPKDSVVIHGITRLDPEAQMIDEYARLRGSLWNPIFRRQRLLNLVNHRPWYAGFDALLSRLPYKELFAEQASGFKYFKHDVQESFKEKLQKEEHYQMDEVGEVTINKSNDSGESSQINWEFLIYQMIGTYINRKLESKYQLKWEQVKDDPKKEKDYRENKEKIAKDAFLAIRSRTGMDFINYFASTLCSVSQHINEESYSALAQALYAETDKVRTLTMLALSARS